MFIKDSLLKQIISALRSNDSKLRLSIANTLEGTTERKLTNTENSPFESIYRWEDWIQEDKICIDVPLDFLKENGFNVNKVTAFYLNGMERFVF